MVALPADLHPSVTAALGRRGIDFLWGHQADALYAADEGHVMVTTGTAPGKSLCFQVRALGRPAVRQFRVLPPPDARAARPRRDGARAVPVPREGAGAGPGALPERLRPP